MTKRRSYEFKVSKPATSALEKAITECISEMKHRKVAVKSVKMVVKGLVSENCKENEIIDGIKDMANTGKLRLGSSRRSINFAVQRKKFVDRTINLSGNETETAANDTSDENLEKVNVEAEVVSNDNTKVEMKDEIMDDTKDDLEDD